MISNQTSARKPDSDSKLPRNQQLLQEEDIVIYVPASEEKIDKQKIEIFSNPVKDHGNLRMHQRNESLKIGIGFKEMEDRKSDVKAIN